MRILIVATEAPVPPVNGFRRHLTALAAELEARHDVRILATAMPDQIRGCSDGGRLRVVPAPALGGSERAAAGARFLTSRLPFRAQALRARLRGPLREELAVFDPDVVHATTGRVALLADEMRGHPRVLAALDAGHLNVAARASLTGGVRRRLLRAEYRRMRRFEARLYRRFHSVITVSEEDRRALLELDPALSVEVIPNGVDAEAFYSGERRRDPDRVVFTGVMDYAPNVTAAEFLARDVMPAVRASCPAARLDIVGRRPTSRVRALADLGWVDVVGEVEDITPWLATSSVYACPMVSGTGIKNKLLEALANGVPCVATPLALQGIRAVPGRDLLVGTSAPEIAGHLIRLLTDAGAAERIGRAGRDYVLAHHGWSEAARAYERVYQSVLSDAR